MPPCNILFVQELLDKMYTSPYCRFARYPSNFSPSETQRSRQNRILSRNPRLLVALTFVRFANLLSRGRWRQVIELSLEKLLRVIPDLDLLSIESYRWAPGINQHKLVLLLWSIELADFMEYSISLVTEIDNRALNPKLAGTLYKMFI
ncbi:hypothetical protein PHYBLDRAFT_72362 [Phycomyces blakesleeanus NRRL 1555(-)]|uniref:Uncharacterized protein n=1 Tax=Phycomyces blakesleeanus (strain ATCC 8743b / DSM 1359 / FGSC 10004 / NBRC 33097 / NRRL 1555) TaxID=763407 RepID=A0A162ZBV9_PHYB8|nr:hypothetical protein PHYBLDRAFT_72362 [Phycomyces blakesleeanus NRRL 1555(-)]OAD65721.1 hypothetical protein PHYBLDRAFT_72362 [Phycomyces blakesleeanus NRRL 1555(-)]|eukprot:XP_018283761.1 hypothetical protein PHYBLDRAFT_72362 [Phycomyces blakesleeanus NRRL 1555(-)]